MMMMMMMMMMMKKYVSGMGDEDADDGDDEIWLLLEALCKMELSGRNNAGKEYAENKVECRLTNLTNRACSATQSSPMQHTLWVTARVLSANTWWSPS